MSLAAQIVISIDGAVRIAHLGVHVDAVAAKPGADGYLVDARSDGDHFILIMRTIDRDIPSEIMTRDHFCIDDELDTLIPQGTRIDRLVICARRGSDIYAQDLIVRINIVVREVQVDAIVKEAQVRTQFV